MSPPVIDILFFLWQCLLSVWITETLWLMWELGTDKEFVRAVVHEDRHGRPRDWHLG